ncbi:MAG: hypothetical protein LBM96_01865 [Methanobrevibacter sp.]|jgi:hypothetical protein|nr:hypothetical protein [Candidatus Methanoflexus mossambicus]
MGIKDKIFYKDDENRVFSKKKITLIIIILMCVIGVCYVISYVFSPSYHEVPVGDESFLIPSDFKLNNSKIRNDFGKNVIDSHFNINGTDNRQYIGICVFPYGFDEYSKFDKTTYAFPFEIDNVKGQLSVYTTTYEYKGELYGNDIACVTFYSDDEKILMEISLNRTDAEYYKEFLDSIKIKQG